MKPWEEEWKTIGSYTGRTFVERPGELTIGPMTIASAKLVSAAPDMARILKDMLDYRECPRCDEPHFIKGHHKDCDLVAVLKKAGVLP